MTSLLNVFNNIHSPTVENYTTISDWFNLIKGSQYTATIEHARLWNNEHQIYKNLKASIPAITYNFTFKNVKSNSNIKESTGLLYIDVDKEGFDIKHLDTTKIFAYYKSFGGEGYALLVQVNGLTSDNYPDTYESICKDLGLVNFHDKNAKKKTQYNVLSYDPDIFINYNSFVYDFVLNPVVIKKEKKTYTTGLSTFLTDTNLPLNFDNLGDIRKSIGQDFECIYNWVGWDFINCWLPFNKVVEGNRNNVLLSYCNNLVWLNPHLTESGAINIMSRVNKYVCLNPLPFAQIKGIVARIFNYKSDGTLSPIVYWKQRKVVFSSKSTLPAIEKFKLSGQLCNENKTELSKQKLNNAIECWDFQSNGKITVRAIVKVAKMGTNTIQKYWPEFKEHVSALNAEFKESKKRESVSLHLKSPINKDSSSKANDDFNIAC